jgi:hypothetical protein
LPAPVGEPPGPEPSPTPLLDAEIRRAQAVTRQHFESIDAAETPAPAAPAVEVPAPKVDPIEAPPAQARPIPVAEPKPAESVLDLTAPLPPLAAATPTAREVEPPPLPAKIVLPSLVPIDPPEPGSSSPVAPPEPLRKSGESPAPSPRRSAGVAEDAEGGRPASPLPVAAAGEKLIEKIDRPAIAEPRRDAGPAPSEGASSKGNHEERPPLEIAALRLGTKVQGFGKVESLNPGALRPGQRLLVYWEMSGLQYQPRGDAFVSRLAAHLELRSGTDGPVVSEHAPRVAESVSPRRLQDYFASYPITMPANLGPGPYRLRLIQTDLIGHRATSRDLPITVIP